MIVLMFAAFTAFSQSKSEREVSDIVKQWAASMVSRDMDALGKILADDIEITDSNGNRRGKKEELQVLKPVPGFITVSVDNEDVKIRIFGKTAIVTALTRMVFNSDNMPVVAAMRYTAVFVKRDGRWQIVALQTMKVPFPNREKNSPPT